MKALLSMIIALALTGFASIASADDCYGGTTYCTLQGSGGYISTWSGGSAWADSEGDTTTNAAGVAGFTNLTIENPIGFADGSVQNITGFYSGQATSTDGPAWSGGGYDGNVMWEQGQYTFGTVPQ